MSATITITQRAQLFLAERRRLGFEARTTGYALLSFGRFMDRQYPKGLLTIERMTDWARRDQQQRRTAGDLGATAEAAAALCPLVAPV